MSDDFQVDVPPLFVLGVPRSGTTYLQQIINSHPQIFVTDELRVVSWLVKEAQRLREGFDQHGNPYPVTYGAEFANYLLGNAGNILAPFYKNQANVAGKSSLRYWGDKYPHYDEVLHLMPMMFPRARYVMIHRDLRDTICSVMTGHGWSVDRSAEYVASIYARYIQKLDHFDELGVAADRVGHIDYRELSNDPRSVSQALFEWLELSYPEEVMREVVRRREVQAHSVRKPGKKEMAFDPSRSIGRWKRDLDEHGQAVVEAAVEAISPAMERARDMRAARAVRLGLNASESTATG